MRSATLHRLFVACALLTLGLLAVTLPLEARRQPVLAPTVFAIRDARVVPEAGQVLPKATVVIRDGLIEAVGADVKPPADALVIDGAGLTVYPGFLDAMSDWGFDAALRRTEAGPPAPEDLASEALAATRPDNRKGITPEFRIARALKAEPKQEEAWRKAGFTAHLIAPDGGTIVGQSALVSLSGAVPRQSVLHTPFALHLAFRRASGREYPRALMGVIAHVRQTLLDAVYYQRVQRHHEKSGGRRPPFDPALAALRPFVEGELPVVFEADSRDEIHRALDFAKEFELRPILYGCRDAWKAADRIKAAGVPVILRINFSEPPERSKSAPPLPARVKQDNERKREEEQKNAAVLAEKGIRFAISTQGQSGDKPADKFRANLRKAIDAGLSPEAALKALTSDAAKVLGVEKRLGTIAPGKAAHLVVTDGDFHAADARVRYVFADGVRFVYEEKEKEKKKKPKPMPPMKGDPKEPEAGANDIATELEEDRKPKTHTGGNVLIKGATVLTVTDGTLTETDILVEKGKITKVGQDLDAPKDVTVIDAKGMFIMPGIVDTHCHFAISGGVNESSLSVVPEVRVRDVIDSEDVDIYRALAGGMTTARLLHGSANVVGGQDAVIKLKYGASASKLLLADAPRGVKFALGENVKRTDGRFPNTRLGVQAVLVRAFSEARAYRKRWQEYENALSKSGADGAPPPPRRDLRLEALADVLAGDLKVHCHSYRADEILMLLGVADRFGFKVKSLQHVLEGYKVAPEIAAHGASCSLFSDWWAYKIEAFDAIPHAAALLQEAGAEVCLKSDSTELMRHLYQEAAKCIKYGGMSEEDALKTITINAARQLGLEKRIGSIEAGKDADLAIFNGHPLNGYARVEMTLVEGEVYFQRSEKLTPFEAAKAGPTKPAKEFKPVAINPQGSYVLKGVTAHVVTNGPIDNADVVIEKGRIKAVVINNSKLSTGNAAADRDRKDLVATLEGERIVVKKRADVFPAGATAIDAKGLHLYPGMIDAGTVVGLTELGSAEETQDYAEGGDFQPDLRASIAINPDSALIPVTRANGVLTVVTRPTGATIAGQSALINLDGWVPREMVVVDPLALHIDFPSIHPAFRSNPNGPRLGRAVARRQREEKVRRLRDLFRQALAHAAAREERPATPANPRLEALLPYARGDKPVIIEAQREGEILEALKLADELKLKVILDGAIDAWKVADELKKRNVPVIVGPVMALPREGHDPYDAPYACPAKLHKAGVKFCIRSAGAANTRNLPYEAAMAAAHGLPPDEALKAVTLYPAQILGVEKELGSIEPGKRANLVLTNGDLLQPSTQVLGLFIDGKPLPPESKHTKLYKRYRQRLREVKEGDAPLGTK